MCHINSLNFYFLLSCYYSINMPYFLLKLRVNKKEMSPATGRGGPRGSG